MNLLTFKKIFEILRDAKMKLNGMIGVEQCCYPIWFFCVSDKGGMALKKGPTGSGHLFANIDLYLWAAG